MVKPALFLAVFVLVVLAIGVDVASIIMPGLQTDTAQISPTPTPGPATLEPLQIDRKYSSSARSQLGPPPPVPVLASPAKGEVINSATVNFSWQPVNDKNFVGYTLRVKTVADMENGGETLLDTGVEPPNAGYTLIVPSQYLDHTLYWSVRSWGAGGEKSKWATSQSFVAK